MKCELCHGNKSLATARKCSSKLKKHLLIKCSSTALAVARTAGEQDGTLTQVRLALKLAIGFRLREINEPGAASGGEDILDT